jgi:tRNA U38,U39,U40 pseudouridine synthase TruA
MVRNLVGTFVSVGRGKIAQSDVKVILAAKDRTQAPATAPAEGLTLTRIFYGDDLSITALLDRQRSGYNLTLYSDWL